MIPIKFYIYGALIIAIAGGGFWFNEKLNENKRLKKENSELSQSLNSAIAGAKIYQENNERQIKLLS